MLAPLSWDEAETLAALIYDNPDACQQVIQQLSHSQYEFFKHEYSACVRVQRGVRYAWTFAIHTASWMRS